MAKILYEVKQNQNSSSVAYGKWFAQVKTLETLNTRKLAQHISEHGSIYTPDVVYGVLEKFRSCLIEMLLESKKVKIEGLGTFYTTLENTKGGAQSKDKFNVNTHLKALHIRFLPEQTTEENISSRQFLKQAEFINIDSLLKSVETETGGDSTGGNSGSNSGSENGTGTINGDSGSGSQNSGSGSNTGSNTGGNQSGNSGSQSGSGESGVAGNYRLNIFKYGSGSATVTDDSEQVINDGSNVASGSNVNISVVPAAGKVPTAKVNSNAIVLTENDGTYTGLFQMPTKGTVLEIDTDPSDDWFDTGD